jgi:hypothetical protein
MYLMSIWPNNCIWPTKVPNFALDNSSANSKPRNKIAICSVVLVSHLISIMQAENVVEWISWKARNSYVTRIKASSDQQIIFSIAVKLYTEDTWSYIRLDLWLNRFWMVNLTRTRFNARHSKGAAQRPKQWGQWCLTFAPCSSAMPLRSTT